VSFEQVGLTWVAPVHFLDFPNSFVDTVRSFISTSKSKALLRMATLQLHPVASASMVAPSPRRKPHPCHLDRLRS
jgi:hypothetical protein